MLQTTPTSYSTHPFYELQVSIKVNTMHLLKQKMQHLDNRIYVSNWGYWRPRADERFGDPPAKGGYRSL